MTTTTKDYDSGRELGPKWSDEKIEINFVAECFRTELKASEISSVVSGIETIRSEYEDSEIHSNWRIFRMGGIGVGKNAKQPLEIIRLVHYGGDKHD